jgi:hypothetical protein
VKTELVVVVVVVVAVNSGAINNSIRIATTLYVEIPRGHGLSQEYMYKPPA